MTDIDNLSADELKALAKQAESLAAAKQAEKTAELFDRIGAELKAAGVSVAQLAAHFAKAPKERKRAINPNDRRHGPRAPKYKHPNDERTWSGRGAQPAWFRDLLAVGHSPESLLIR